MATLETALKDEALQAFTRALEEVLAAPEHAALAGHPNNAGGNVLLAVDVVHRAVLQVLASGAGGRAFYERLGVARLVSVDSTTMRAEDVRARIGVDESGVSVDSAAPVVFVLPPRLTAAKLVADSVRSLEGRRRCGVLWLPAATSECTLEMERQGVAGFVAQRSLSLGLVPIDDRVAALCHDAVFGDLYVKGDRRALTDVVRSILAVERHTGARIRDVACHGEFARQVKSMLELAHKVAPQSLGGGRDTSAIEKLVLVDRMQDPLSMLLTPMTYEGLLDALLDVNHGVVSYTPAKLATGSNGSNGSGEDGDSGVSSGGAQTVLLNHRDELYREIRDVNFNVLISRRLADIAQDLVSQARGTGTAASASHAPSSGGESRSSGNEGEGAVAFAQVAALLKKVPDLVKKKQSLAHHLHLVHEIQDRSREFALRGCVETEMAVLSASKSVVQDADRFLEEAVLRDPPLPLHDAAKLLCLSSLVRGGLRPEKLLWYRRQLCHAHGYDAMALLVQLEKLELLSATTSASRQFDFPSIKKKLALMRGALEDEDALAARDIHFMFPYTGYAPLSVRLVQDTLGINAMASTVGRRLSDASSSAPVASGDSVWSTSSSHQQQRADVLVYYIGGVTVAELAAYRFLNQTQAQYTFIVAATAVCNGSRLLRAI
ncbi:hypothetical protein PybrP1_009255 [[Pythium] brassicae (nom. inval.)]|nr:hypothetical protein PybrP1_009255 [[Pythium] brassicae (nom. inval.)]